MTTTPAPAVARSARERKAAQRARDVRAVIEAIGREADADARALVEILRCGLVGKAAAQEPWQQRSAWRAWRELGQRNGWIDGSARVIDPDPDDV
jgi:hypothetical protein